MLQQCAPLTELIEIIFLRFQLKFRKLVFQFAQRVRRRAQEFRELAYWKGLAFGGKPVDIVGLKLTFKHELSTLIKYFTLKNLSKKFGS